MSDSGKSNRAIDPPPRFAGQTALITGASDRGIGGAVAERLAREGASLALLGRSEPARLIKRLQRRDTPLTWRTCDIRRAAEVTAAVAAAAEKFGQLNVVINNAGLEITSPFESLSEEMWREVVDVNLSGAARVTLAALPHVPSGGAIVNVASVLGLAGCAGFTAYSASKAGLIGLTQSLAFELAPRRIRVLCVAPALVHTPMVHKHTHHLNETARRKIEACHPLDVGLPHDVAAAVAFLASPEARWITGVTLPLGWAPSFPLPVDDFLAARQADTMRDAA